MTMTKEQILKIGFITIGSIVLVNMTPHQLNIVQTDGKVLTVEPSGFIPRCASTEKLDQSIGLIDVTSQTLGEVEGLPESLPGAFYIVSRLVASAASGRDDLLVPGPLVRDDQGRVIGCKGLSRL